MQPNHIPNIILSLPLKSWSTMVIASCRIALLVWIIWPLPLNSWSTDFAAYHVRHISLSLIFITCIFDCSNMTWTESSIRRISSEMNSSVWEQADPWFTRTAADVAHEAIGSSCSCSSGCGLQIASLLFFPWVDLYGCNQTLPELHDKWCAMLVCPRHVTPVQQMVCHTTSGWPLVCLYSVWIIHHKTASLESASCRSLALVIDLNGV